MASEEFKIMIESIKEKHPVLEDEKIQEMLKEYKETGNKEIYDKIILSNVGLALKFVNQYQYVSNFLDTEDLFSETIEGLSNAIDKYDPEKNVKFSTYAAKWIKQRILRAISNNNNTIRIPVHYGEGMRKVRNYLKEQSLLGRNNLSVDEIMQDTGLSKEIVTGALNSIEKIYSLNETINNDGKETELMEFIPLDNSIEEQMEKEETENALYDAIDSKLNKKEKEIILRRYGLSGKKPETLESIGKDLKLSRERIRQLEEKAILKLRRSPQLRSVQFK